jgi:hypothetical protein
VESDLNRHHPSSSLVKVHGDVMTHNHVRPIFNVITVVLGAYAWNLKAKTRNNSIQLQVWLLQNQQVWFETCKKRGENLQVAQPPISC